MITDKDIKHVIRTCCWRDDVFAHRRYLSEVICRGMCLPCKRVIEKGQCPELIKLFNADKAESEKE